LEHGLAWIVRRGAGVTRDGIQGALVALAIGFGSPVLWSQDAQESAPLIQPTARQLRLQGMAAIRRPVRTHGKRARQVYRLTGLPNMGPGRDRTRLDRFGTFEGVIKAEPAALTGVAGIGPQTAQRIHWAVHDITIP
jgi:ERCC4-type nuclease